MPLPGGTLLNINVPAGEASGVEVARLGKRIYRDQLELQDEQSGRRQYRIYGDAPGYRARGGHRPRRGRRGPHRGHAAALRPHGRAGHRDAAGVRPRPPAAAGRRRARANERRRPTAPPSSAPSSPTTGTATTSSTTPRSATTPTTRCSTSCAGSRPSTRSSSRPTRRRSASAGSPSRGSTRSGTCSRCSRSPTSARAEELRAWVARMRSHLAREGIEDPAFAYVAEPKIDGLAISLVYRDGVLRARRDPRQRRGRRGRHAQPAHGRRDPAADRRRAAAGGGPRRGLHVAARLPGAQRAPRRAGPLHVHEPAQLGRGDDPPARPRAGRRAPALHVVLRHRRDGGPGLRAPLRGARLAARPRLPREPGHRGADHGGRGGRARARAGASAAAAWTSRSTASW